MKASLGLNLVFGFQPNYKPGAGFAGVSWLRWGQTWFSVFMSQEPEFEQLANPKSYAF